MSFLAPLFLLGTLVVALPVLFHLTRRSTRRKQTFSSLQFLRPTPPRLTQRNRLEHIFLLLLRGGIVALIAFAFARPFLHSPAAILPQAAPPQSLILLIDTSASMQREDLWTQALSRVRQRLLDLAPTDDVAVLTFDRAPRTLVHFEQWRQWTPTDRAAFALERLEAIRPGWAATHLDTALIHAIQSLEEIDARSDHAAERNIAIFSDLPDGARLDSLQGYEWPQGVQVRVEQLTPQHAGNAGIHWIVATDPHPPGPSTESTPRIQIVNSQDSAQVHFQVAWSGATGEGSSAHVHVPPGQSRILHAPPAPTETDSARLVLLGDSQPFDNHTHVLTPVPEQIPLLFVGSDPPDDPAQLLFYLQRAFPPNARQSVHLHVVAPGSPAPELDLRQVRLAILASPAPDTLSQALDAYVQSGGTILAVLRPHTAPQLLSSLFPDMAWRVDEPPVQDFALLAQIDFSHPLFAPFADPRYSDFTRIHFWKHRRLISDAVPTARIVARFDTGDPALLEINRGAGRILVLTAGWHPADGQLALSSKFVPFLHALLDHAAGPRPPLPQYRVGDSVTLPTPGDSPIRIEFPDGTALLLEPGATQFTDTTVPGIYTAAASDRSWSFAVNLDPSESRTTPVPLDELERLGIPLQLRAAEDQGTGAREQQLQRVEMESRQNLWRWLIFAALLILLLESWLAGRLTRPASEPATS
jgi:hypothetical protein